TEASEEQKNAKQRRFERRHPGETAAPVSKEEPKQERDRQDRPDSAPRSYDGERRRDDRDRPPRRFDNDRPRSDRPFDRDRPPRRFDNDRPREDRSFDRDRRSTGGPKPYGYDRFKPTRSRGGEEETFFRLDDEIKKD
ncbi:MAG: hypothetical protein PHR90_04310, partial [Sphaerochaetaceae bacterium]|nr:hypothetical protein [Sphaerochaetaceae bacterium]